MPNKVKSRRAPGMKGVIGFYKIPPIYDSGDIVVSQPTEGIQVGVEYGPNVSDWKGRLKRKDGVVTLMFGEDLTVNGNSDISGHHLMYQNSTGLLHERAIRGDTASLVGMPTFSDYSGLVAECDDAAKMLFVEYARKAQRSMQGLVTIGELRETINMIRRPLKALRGYADNLRGAALERRRRMKGSSSKALRQAMANTWLEWSFGASPLVKDVVDGCQAAARVNTFHPPYKFIVAEKKSGFNEETLVGSGTVGGIGLTIKTKIGRSGQISVKYYGSVRTTIPGVGLTASQFGVSFHDALPAVWELVPYSFLIDYFTNVGKIIEAVCFPMASVVWIARTARLEHSRSLLDAEFTGPSESADLRLLENSLTAEAGCQISRTSFERANFGGSLVPSLRFNIGERLGLKRELNIAALVAAGKLVNKRPF